MHVMHVGVPSFSKIAVKLAKEELIPEQDGELSCRVSSTLNILSFNDIFYRMCKSY
jgi:hypothetical protein